MARVTRQSQHALSLAPGLDVFAVIKTVSFDEANVAATPRAEFDA